VVKLPRGVTPRLSHGIEAEKQQVLNEIRGVSTTKSPCEGRKRRPREFHHRLLSRQIRQLRESRGLSQAQLARALRMHAPAISRIEDADYDGHSLRILRKIAVYFDHELILQTATPRVVRQSKIDGLL